MKIKDIFKKGLPLLLIIVAWLAPADVLHAQVSFRFMPALNGQTVNGLFVAQLQNAGLSTYDGKIKITVRDGGTLANLFVRALQRRVLFDRPSHT